MFQCIELSIEVIVDNSITSTSNIGIYTDAVTVNVTAGNEDNNYAIWLSITFVPMYWTSILAVLLLLIVTITSLAVPSNTRLMLEIIQLL